MNRERLTFVSGLSLLCLLASSLLLKAVATEAKTTELPPQQLEDLPTLEESTPAQAEESFNTSATEHPTIQSTELTQARVGGTDGFSNPDVVRQDSTSLSEHQLEDANSADVPSSLNASSLPQASSSSTMSQPIGSNLLAQQVENNALEPSPMGQVNSVSQLAQSDALDSSPMEQVTSVSQLSDVQPTDWAYEALRSLVERYGCIAGYPDGTFRGNRAMTRYEFAAGLNACLQQVERLIAANTADLVTKQDLATLQRLVEEFRTELTTLGTRVNNLEERVAFLEDHQFSTTTKLGGEAIFSIVGATGGEPGANDPNVILVDRVRLNFNTSFTGKDLLITGLQASNFGGDVTGAGSVQGSLFPGSSFLSEGMTKLSFEPQFPRFNPQDLSSVASNSIELYKLLYIFPSGFKNLTLFAGTAAEVSDAFPAVIPFSSEGQGAISRFATLNPVARISGGTSQRGLASAVGFIWTPSPKFDFRALYGSVNAAIPNQEANNVLGAGFFSGSTVAAAQLTVKPTNSIDIGLNYARSYHDLNILGIGTSRFSASPLFIPGVTDSLAGALNTPVSINSVGATVTWRFTPKIAFTGYGAYFFVDAAAGADASSNFSSWMAGLYFQDLLKEGNTAGLLFGQPLYRVSADGAARLTEPGVDRATPYHLEAFYSFKVSNNINITPGAFVLFNPEGDSNNDTTLVGVLRTTFSF
jgi:BMFP domain-containing protein YqiC